jgi:cell division protein FtsB
MNYLIVLLLYSNLSGIFGKSKSERLLLNDPSVLADRLGRLENSVTILKQTVATQNAELQIQKTTIQALEQENTKLSIQNQHHTSDIQQLLNSVSNHGITSSAELAKHFMVYWVTAYDKLLDKLGSCHDVT